MPWQLSYAASADLENSELQTDVMRFMAILAFCLVAIFAIVQTMPLETLPAEPQNPQSVTAAPLVNTTAVAAVTVPDTRSQPRSENRVVTGPPQTRKPVQAPVRTVQPRPVKPERKLIASPVVPVTTPKPQPEKPASMQRSKPEPVKPKPMQEPKPAAMTIPALPKPLAKTELPPAPTEQGLSLSFESDQVLRDLVARGLVGLYAIEGDDFYQMHVSGNDIDFGPGAAPAQYHEMVYETVPGEVARVFEAQHYRSPENVVWGVTLPAGTTSQLRRFVQTRYSGELIITADAQLSLAGSS